MWPLPTPSPRSYIQLSFAVIAPSPPPPPIGFQYLQLEPSCPQLIVFNYSEKKNRIFGLAKWRYISLVDALLIVGDGLLFSMIAFGFWDQMDFLHAPKSGLDC